MIDMLEGSADVAPLPGRRPRRWLWAGLALGLAIVIAGVSGSVVLVRHYLDATGLSTDGGWWLPPDNAHIRAVQLGQYSGSVIAPRPGHWQTVQLELINSSSVSQTVLGLVDGKTLADPKMTQEPERVTVSTGSAVGDVPAASFTSKPVTIPPGGEYELRYSQLTAPAKYWPCRSEFLSELDLRVRVGMFTRTVKLSLNNLIFEIRGPNSSSC